MRFRFQLPAMPNTPCQVPYSRCGLTGSEQLRYMSLTFGYQSAAPANLLEDYVAYPGGVDPATANTPRPLISLADNAFAQTPGAGGAAGNNYVTLLVNVGATLPAWLQQTTANGVVGVTGGVQPVLNPNTYDTYSVWQVQGYTVLDLEPVFGRRLYHERSITAQHPKHIAEHDFCLFRRGRSLLHRGVCTNEDGTAAA